MTSGPSVRLPGLDTAESERSAQYGEDDSIDDLDDLPDDDTPIAASTGFGLYDAHEEAATW
ncbi:hypothetical protein ACWGIU_06580 [Streptomyces sp. NPDC054840]